MNHAIGVALFAGGAIVSLSTLTTVISMLLKWNGSWALASHSFFYIGIPITRLIGGMFFAIGFLILALKTKWRITS